MMMTFPLVIKQCFQKLFHKKACNEIILTITIPPNARIFFIRSINVLATINNG